MVGVRATLECWSWLETLLGWLSYVGLKAVFVRAVSAIAGDGGPELARDRGDLSFVGGGAR